MLTKEELKKAEEIYCKILDSEIANKMPREIINKGIATFRKRLEDIFSKTHTFKHKINKTYLTD